MGTFGVDCRSQCNCRGGEPCDPITGACICEAGTTGADCEKKCPEGTFGVGCAQQCKCENNASCDSASGACTCQVRNLGFFGHIYQIIMI